MGGRRWITTTQRLAICYLLLLLGLGLCLLLRVGDDLELHRGDGVLEEREEEDGVVQEVEADEGVEGHLCVKEEGMCAK